MSQSGYTPIQLYRTTTAAATPTAGNLAAGELAINLTDEKLYFKNAGGTVKLLASTDTLGTVTSVAASGGTTGLTFSGSPITTSGTLTLGGTLGVANGGTGTTTAFTAGSVVFAGASGVYSQDNANLFWDNTNDWLGIGTATPAYRLDVNGAINVAAGQYIRSGSAFLMASNGTSLNYIYSGSGALVWRNGADTAELMRLENGGNVGIGTSAPNAKLEVAGQVRSTTGTGFKIVADYGDYRMTTINGRGWRMGTTSNGTNLGNFYIQGSTDDFTTSFINSVYIDTSGNVGIGTSSPATTLHARKDSAGGTTYAIYTDNGAAGAGTNVAGIGFTNGNAMKSSITAAVYNNDFLAFNVGGSGTTERMRIDASGNVGIGTSSPANRLDVQTPSGTNVAINATKSGTDAVQIGVDTGPYVNGGANLGFRVGGTERFRITSTGGITSSDLADAVGYKGLPQNSQTGSYTLVLGDMGKHISITTGGVVIPANGSVAFPIGATIVVFNNSGSTQTISITTDTLRLAGSATTGSRTLAQYGLATLVKVTSTVWVATGNVT